MCEQSLSAPVQENSTWLQHPYAFLAVFLVSCQCKGVGIIWLVRCPLVHNITVLIALTCVYASLLFLLLYCLSVSRVLGHGA